MWTEELRAYVTKRRMEGVSYSELARELNVTRSAMGGMLRRMGLQDQKIGEQVAANNPQYYAKKKRMNCERKKQLVVTVRPRLVHSRPPIKVTKIPIPEPPPMPFESKKITLIELDANTCRAPEEVEGEVRYCGMSTGNKTYCEHHRQLFYEKRPRGVDRTNYYARYR
jgi:hypothetical protein